MSAQKRPNILFMLTDDQRHDTIHALGNRNIVTPTMDWLVANGTTFNNAYIMGGSHEAVCMPSRAMIMTGRTLYHIEQSGETIARDHTLLGEALQDAGYTTFATGKWHNSPASYARGFTRGGEIFFSGMDDHWNVPVCDFDPTGEYARRNYQTVDFVMQKVAQKIYDHIHAGKHSSELFSETAIDFLRSYDSDKPFFAYVAFMAPHDPRTMPGEYLAMYNPAKLPLPANFMPQHPFDNGEMTVRDELLAALPRDPGEVRRHLAAYYGMITHLDVQMGRIINTLRETGKLDNTIIIFAGDNGLALGAHGLMGKQCLYEHSVRVPMVMRVPGIAGGAQSAALTQLLDIYPTLCDLIGVPIPATVEGRSLAPVLRRQTTTHRDHLLFAYRHIQRAVRDDSHKLIEYHVGNQHTTQLFDLLADPFELANLAASPAAAGHLQRLRSLLATWRTEYDDTRPDGATFWAN